jgi:hypothetical protein
MISDVVLEVQALASRVLTLTIHACHIYFLECFVPVRCLQNVRFSFAYLFDFICLASNYSCGPYSQWYPPTCPGIHESRRQQEVVSVTSHS